MNTPLPASIIPAGMESAGPDYGFAPGRIANGFLFISGQIGVTPEGKIADSVQEQARLALEAIGRILAEAGLDFSDVIELTTFHVGDCTTVNEWFLALKKPLFTDPYPTWTSLGVTSLALPGVYIEIKAIAALRQV